MSVLNPSLVDAHSNLGNLYKAQGRLEDAKRCYTEAIRIKPDFSIAWSNLAGLFKDEGDLKTAIAYYSESIRLCPEFADAHSNLGNAFKESGQLDEAMKCYKKSINLRPDFAIAHGTISLRVSVFALAHAPCVFFCAGLPSSILTYFLMLVRSCIQETWLAATTTRETWTRQSKCLSMPFNWNPIFLTRTTISGMRCERKGSSKSPSTATRLRYV